MPQKFLDTAQIGTVFEKMGGKTVAQGMRCGAASRFEVAAVLFKQALDGTDAQTRTSQIDEKWEIATGLA